MATTATTKNSENMWFYSRLVLVFLFVGHVGQWDGLEIPSQKLTWNWNIHYKWRCISYWKMWIFQCHSLVFQGVSKPIPNHQITNPWHKKHCQTFDGQVMRRSFVGRNVKKWRGWGNPGCWQLFKELLGCLEIKKSTNQRLLTLQIYGMDKVCYYCVSKSYIILYLQFRVSKASFGWFSRRIFEPWNPMAFRVDSEQDFLEIDKKWLVISYKLINHNTWHGVTSLRGNISPVCWEDDFASSIGIGYVSYFPGG